MKYVVAMVIIPVLGLANFVFGLYAGKVASESSFTDLALNCGSEGPDSMSTRSRS